MAVTQKTRPEKHELDALLEGAENTHSRARRSLQVDGDADIDSNTKWVPEEKIFAMGTGAIDMQQPEQVEIANPRVEFDPEKEERMMDSLRAKGQLVAVLGRMVRRNGEWVYELIEGERRVRCIRRLRKEEPNNPRWRRVKMDILKADNFEAFETAIISHIHREDHNMAERSAAIQRQKSLMEYRVSLAVAKAKPTGPNGQLTAEDYNRAMKLWTDEPDWVLDIMERARSNQQSGRRLQQPTVTWDDVAIRVGVTKRQLMSYASISEMPEEITRAIEFGALSGKKALLLAKLTSPAQQTAAARAIIKNKLTLDQAGAYVHNLLTKEKQSARGKKPTGVHPVLERLNPALSELATAKKRAEKATFDEDERTETRKLVTRLKVLVGELEAIVGAEE